MVHEMEGRIIMKHSFRLLLMLSAFVMFFSCSQEKEHTAPAINTRDSVSMMTSYGVNTLISDSGVMKYRIIAEKWEVNEVRNPSRWIFERGIFLEQFDDKFHIEAFIQSDTAYYFDKDKIWELRGRVKVRTTDGLRFSSEELFWNQNRHELYSNKFSRLITPDRELQGSYFKSDEKLTHYYISNTKGSFVKDDMMSNGNDTIMAAPDTVKQNLRLRPVASSRQ